MSATSSRPPVDPPSDAGAGDLAFWLALLRAPTVGARVWRHVSARRAGPRDLFDAPRALLETLGAKPALMAYLRVPDWPGVERDLSWLRGGPQRSVLTLVDDRYPPLLREIVSPPPVLFVQGDPAALATLQIAIVGSRNPTPAGERTAREFAAALATSGITITSGLAVGIDAASHRGACDAAGRTVAVIGTGPDRVYPHRHVSLMAEVVDAGAVVSEFPVGTPPLPTHFPRRNRIISGLSVGTLVVEASLRSGSLITAKAALEQGREVFAIPGSIHNPLARGCHALIKDGAKLVETVADILDELTGFGVASASPPTAGSPAARPEAAAERLLKYVAWEPTSVDTLVTASGMSADEVAYLLLDLELKGYVASTPTGCYCRITYDE